MDLVKRMLQLDAGQCIKPKQNVAAKSEEKDSKEADVQPEISAKKESWLRGFVRKFTEAFYYFHQWWISGHQK